MKCFLAPACAALLFAAPSIPAPGYFDGTMPTGEIVQSGPGTEHFAGAPPERFMGDNFAVVVFLTDVTEICGAPPKGFVRLGCSYEDENGVPIIVITQPCPHVAYDEYARITCHEPAHRNGWPGDHPL